MDHHGKLLVSVLIITCAIALSIAMAKPGTTVAKQCADRVDNDGDGRVDLNDPGCSSKTDTSEHNLLVECDDGLDNDGDGWVDYLDVGCSSPTDTDESDCGDLQCEGSESCASCTDDCGWCDSCSDSDNGMALYIPGTVSGYLNNQPYSHTDYCGSESVVFEHYCAGTAWHVATFPCAPANVTNSSSYCVDGACV